MACATCAEMRQGLMGGFKQWLASPFQADMNAVHWIAFIGLLLVALALWSMLFRHVKGFEP
jgi:hypothetical protein